MKTRLFNKEVLYADEPIVQVGSEEIERLKEKLLLNERRRIRLCTHRDIKDQVHEMLIIHTRGAYVRPHKHIGKTESFHLIEGSADVVIFDDTGKIVEIIRMGDYSSGKRFFYRICGPCYHTLLIKSDFLVFHEVTKGPFDKSDTLFPSWAPEDTDVSASNEYIKVLTGQAQEALRG